MKKNKLKSLTKLIDSINIQINGFEKKEAVQLGLARLSNNDEPVLLGYSVFMVIDGSQTPNDDV